MQKGQGFEVKVEHTHKMFWSNKQTKIASNAKIKNCLNLLVNFFSFSSFCRAHLSVCLTHKPKTYWWNYDEGQILPLCIGQLFLKCGLLYSHVFYLEHKILKESCVLLAALISATILHIYVSPVIKEQSISLL